MKIESPSSTNCDALSAIDNLAKLFFIVLSSKDKSSLLLLFTVTPP
ncbi:hypothetical protein B0I60_000379 [Clostridium beijerinckii]|nr:hypothetical protein [Clostridium beijerinckii]